MRRSAGSRHAFTLVELLVVVGVISLLIAILFPALSRARSHARRIQCASNLRSMGQAMTMYVQQWGCYPGCIAVGTAAPNPGAPAIWPTRLRLFIGGDTKVFLCPTRDERFAWEPNVLPPLIAPIPPNGTMKRWASADYEGYGYVTGERVIQPWYEWFSYGYNAWGTNDRPPYNLGLGRYIVAIRDSSFVLDQDRELRASRVKLASEMIAIGDSNGDGDVDVMLKPAKVGGVHDDGANILFCDCHVEWHLQGVLANVDASDRRTYPVRKLWNNDNLP